MFLKYMIIEYLICHSDGYLGNGNNFFIYVKPNNEKYYFFSYDFDLTFGKWCFAKEGTIDDYILHVLDDPSEPPPTYGSETKKRDPFLYTQIINHPEIRPKFDQLLKDIVQNLFNLNALGPRIDYFYEFLRDDMYWDIDNYAFNTFDTKYFNKKDREQELPNKAKTDAQYNELDTDTENLKSFIKYKSENIAQIFNIQLQSKGEFGEVGGKLMTIGKAKNDDNNNNSDKTTASGSSIRINKSSFSSLLITTIISILIILMIF
ncbi:hypothetical protein BCR32DRAFT_304528 [Anaeromyces robustus]|uniref:Coth-domain-containing protein n=1 Tax=Anaeromyces robustus TaxID=1754192 RepID=A0A1Y1XIB0_9FUNG|nr:hypothetical protein BCR32DRAFT_304528 [Anaeromyces robustus]|eukprot:ORX85511.1 hypothetical protein BCR32DRAFT_304528 [Anaeromyces robustus]